MTPTPKEQGKTKPYANQDPFNPNYLGPVMVEESRDKPFDWRTVVPETPKRGLEGVF